jgi:hypothetical protein
MRELGKMTRVVNRPGTHPSATHPAPLASHQPETVCRSAIDRDIFSDLVIIGNTALDIGIPSAPWMRE